MTKRYSLVFWQRAMIVMVLLLRQEAASFLVNQHGRSHFAPIASSLRVSNTLLSLNATDSLVLPYADDYAQPQRPRSDNNRNEHRSWTCLSERFRLPHCRNPIDKPPSSCTYEVYCDLDGVLVDFGHGISKAFGAPIPVQNIDALPRGLLWQKVQQMDRFFEFLPWMEGGRELWQGIAVLQPHILTGVPSYCSRAPRDEKFAWCLRELAHHTNHLGTIEHIDKAAPLRTHASVRSHKQSVRQQEEWNCKVITCWSERKHHESGPNKVLIDDRIDLKAAWEAKGGIFIHHCNAHDTLAQLKQLGILPPDTSDAIWSDSITP